jgi:predicted AAA+ superfamily ATPase
LQIGSPQQASRDPLLGNLFENLVVLEIVKALYTRDLLNPLSFYREQKGLEIDLILEHHRIPHGIGIKSSRTFHPDFAGSLRQFKERFPQVGSLRIVYGGDEDIQGSEYRVWSFSHTANLPVDVISS